MASSDMLQSPIDIVPANVEIGSEPPLDVEYPSEPIPVEVRFAVVDGDETPDGVLAIPQVVVTPLASDAHVRLRGRRFDLQSFHWHSPSEHLIDGEAYPLELHLVHRTAEGGLLVIGVLSSVGEPDPSIAPVFSRIRSLDVDGRAGESVQMRIDALLPEAPVAYRYEGSLTTAPFTEGVRWLVCSDTRTASQDQIDVHMDIVSIEVPGYADRPRPDGNARRVQELAGRSVVEA